MEWLPRIANTLHNPNTRLYSCPSPLLTLHCSFPHTKNLQMQRKVSRHTLLGHACWLALCYLLAGAGLAVAQTPVCVAPHANDPNCHVVVVGPGGQVHFHDVDSNSDSGDPVTNNAVITVIPVGHTVQWQFIYTHSSTAGTCNPVSFQCTPNGQWDSTILNVGGIHTVTFNQAGIFTYFCGVHFTAMRGMVVVLNGPDYNVFADDPTFSPVPPHSLTIFAGDNGSFAGNLDSYKNFVSQLNLSCINGSGNPRLPGGCPTSPTGVNPNSNLFSASTPFSFPISENIGGDYSFDVFAAPAGGPPFPSPFSHKKTLLLHVNDLGLAASSNLVTAYRGDDVQTTVQAKSLGLFNGTISSVTCDVTPAGGPTCMVTPSTFTLGAGASQNLNVSLTNTTVTPTNYTVNLSASSFANNPGPGNFTRTKGIALALKPAERFMVTPDATSVAPGAAFVLTVRAVDAAGMIKPNYNSTVQFTSSDPAARVGGQLLPTNYTFQPSDNGIGTFSVTFNTVGPRIFTVTDTTPFATTGTSAIVRVDGGDPADNDIALTSSLPGDAYFQNENVTFTAAVTATPSGTPQGSVQFFDGATALGAAVALTGAGSTRTAQKTLSLLIGDHPITAVFQPAPASGFTANVSAPLLQRRSPAPRCVAGGLCPGSH